MRVVKHIDEIDVFSIEARFIEDRAHRLSLYIPFRIPQGKKVLCIVGQNPSEADETRADNTIRFLEKLVVSKKLPYRAIRMLNLFTRVDTRKEESRVDSRVASWRDPILEAARSNDDFLMVFGKLSRQGNYDFPARARELKALLAQEGVTNIQKLGLHPPVAYAPHPGNRRIGYWNLEIALERYDFEDLDA